MRRKSRPRSWAAVSCCLLFCIPEITSFLPELYILLAILKRSDGVRDNNISLYNCSIRFVVSLIFLRLLQDIVNSNNGSPFSHICPIKF